MSDIFTKVKPKRFTQQTKTIEVSKVLIHGAFTAYDNEIKIDGFVNGLLEIHTLDDSYDLIFDKPLPSIVGGIGMFQHVNNEVVISIKNDTTINIQPLRELSIYYFPLYICTY